MAPRVFPAESASITFAAILKECTEPANDR
ncbi:hypothetical protein F4556_007147 [Kitasatospora gansuensis]|uniref:Uncharacterized protein n=1 Tax=Kitasatospora gansuensis TaxID=258050 RepID=A0A7W7WLB0_9ACTN|nr:hypothetical protein [Kitasatospora gansuensis]